MAVAFIMGVYLGGLVQALVKDLLMPLIGLVLPGIGNLATFKIAIPPTALDAQGNPIDPNWKGQLFGIGDFLVAFITGAFGSYLGYTMQLEGTMAMLIGSIIGNKVVSRILSRRSNIPYGVFANRFYMGGAIGWSLMESIRALLILVSRSMWLLPY